MSEIENLKNIRFLQDFGYVCFLYVVCCSVQLYIVLFLKKNNSLFVVKFVRISAMTTMGQNLRIFKNFSYDHHGSDFASQPSIIIFKFKQQLK
jgi:hypothetical protein